MLETRAGEVMRGMEETKAIVARGGLFVLVDGGCGSRGKGKERRIRLSHSHLLKEEGSIRCVYKKWYVYKF